MDLFQRLKYTFAQNLRPVVHIPNTPHTPPVRRRYRFSGLVQGVGFRYEAKLLAAQLRLTGWARNENDGTVVIELEGEASRIEAFLQAMQTVPRFDITDIEAEDLPVSGSESAFKVLY